MKAITKIIIDGGNIFEGDPEQFADCFFTNVSEANIRHWAENDLGGATVKIERDGEEMDLAEVIVTVVGGVVQHVEVPKGVCVKIRDYDVDEEDLVHILTRDEDGDAYSEGIWEYEG